ncbi:ATP-binding protein [Ideonella azotifigens]|uniref:Guanylate cyclase n=1 Tax=Ideonella azotifigens TaxID=513160 RepID=A0ABP3VK88_9BURK|nr:ATP-binding protein [Ideonella azotifigens]MCD2343070.1 ATP-binding protein [Ideonella azotifigens]
MSAASLNLTPAQFAAAFPFHMVLDRQLRLLQVGTVLGRVCPEMVPGAALAQQFRLVRPVLAQVDFEAIAAREKALFVFRHREGLLQLRGEMVVQGEQVFFLGSPWVGAMASLRRIGLTLNDFAVHDPVVDLLFLLQTKDKALADAQELSRRLSAQKDSLNAAHLAAEVAVAASRTKSEFLAVMSHEIRTPLNGVLGMLQYLLASDLRPDQRLCAETAARSGKTLLSIINDILDFSKVEAGKLELEQIPLDPQQLAQEAVELVAFQASDKGLALACEVAPGVPQLLLGDPGRIRQVLINFLANAIKFTRVGQVTLRVGLVAETDTHATLRLEVQDTGIGIESVRQQSIFEPFTQADLSTTRQYSGTGLGLAICRKLAELMGGEVGLQSQAGQGSSFWLTVSLEKAKREDGPAALPLKLPSRFSGHLLLGEDDPVNQQIAMLHLAALGLTVDVFGNGADAMQAAAHGGYDMALMDLRMPVMDGLTACRAIRQLHGPAGRLPIIIWTASMLDVDQQRITEAGANGVLGKPFELDALKRVLARFLPADGAAS